MPEVTNELMYEVLETIQRDVHGLKDGMREVKQELISLRGDTMSIQNDVHNIYGILARREDRLERIENRRELRELAEAQRPFRPE